MTDPSVLSTRAMLARVSISTWQATKLDKRVTKETNRIHAASDDAGRYNKSLIAKDSLAEIGKARDAARMTHARLTLPWLDDGARILPVAAYPTYVNALREHREAFEGAVSAFVLAYPSFVEQAKRDLNGMFSAEDYPGAKEIEAKFSFATRLLPVPDARDWRVEMSEDSAAILKADVEQATREAMAGALRDAWERVADAVGRMAERLRAYKPKTGAADRVEGKFTDTLTSNIRDLVALLPILNIAGDPRLTDVAARMERDLCVHEPAELRANARARSETAAAAESILADVASFLA